MASKSVDSYQCQHCLQIMKNGSHLKEHYYQKHFFCKECEKKLETRDEMIKHLTVQHGQKLRCDFCQYSSLRQREIQVCVTLSSGVFEDKGQLGVDFCSLILI